MRLLLSVLFLLFLLPHHLLADDCPQTQGESSACSLENLKVKTVLKTHKPAMMLKYCGVNGTHPKACRAIVRYKNQKGVLSTEIFEEWFIANPELKNQTQYRSFMVINSNGQYDSFWVDEFVGGPKDTFSINFSDPKQKNIDVTFSGLFPTYDFHYLSVSGKPPVRGVFAYSIDNVTIQKYDTGEEGLLERLVYTLESIAYLE